MAKSYKPKGGNYISSTGIVHGSNHRLLSELLNDTGWIEVQLGTNITTFSWEKLAYRRIGDIVFIHGGISIPNGTTWQTVLATGFPRPRQDTGFLCANNATSTYMNLILGNDGNLRFGTGNYSEYGTYVQLCYITKDL